MIEANIASVAHKLIALCKPSSSLQDVGAPTSVADTAMTTPTSSIFLPIPGEIATSLVANGCPLAAARHLSDIYISSAHQIREMYTSIHRQAWQKVASHLQSDPGCLASFESLKSVPERQYREQIQAVEQLARNRAQAFSQLPRTSRVKPVFNQVCSELSQIPTPLNLSKYQEFVPFLEKYFEYNAYPSAPDRAALARKSMMTPRQIEVWVSQFGLSLRWLPLSSYVASVSKSSQPGQEGRQSSATTVL
jgi:hypothetical protein